METIVYLVLGALGLLCLVLQFAAKKFKRNEQVGNNPQFLRFQRGYFVVYLIAMFADWLQGPYLYKLYSYYGFQEEQIAVLYVFGFASTVLFGTWTPIAADQFGRKKLCVFFTIVYSLSCFFKLSRNFGILCIGRLLGGLATSVLFSAFEAWYVHEHIETHDFPKEWIPITFSKASTWNGIIAVIAGITANIFSEGFGLGPVAPYMVAVPFLLFAGLVVSTHWNENYSGHKVKFRALCSDGFKSIVTNEKIFMLGAIEALYESVMYIIIFLWTPILDRSHHPPLGLVFSTFMVCILIGQAIFQILSSRNIPAQHLLMGSIGIATVANLMCVISTHPNSRSITVSFLAFLIFQFAIGVYFPAMGFLRSRIIPDTQRVSIMNWFRIPINIISCALLMALHDDAFRHGNHMIFVICVILMVLAIFSCVRFMRIVSDDEDLNQDKSLVETDHIHNIF